MRKAAPLLPALVRSHGIADARRAKNRRVELAKQ